MPVCPVLSKISSCHIPCKTLYNSTAVFGCCLVQPSLRPVLFHQSPTLTTIDATFAAAILLFPCNASCTPQRPTDISQLSSLRHMFMWVPTLMLPQLPEPAPALLQYTDAGPRSNTGFSFHGRDASCRLPRGSVVQVRWLQVCFPASTLSLVIFCSCKQVSLSRSPSALVNML